VFQKLTNIVSGKNLHINKLYDEATRLVASSLPDNVTTTTMFFMLQRGADRMIYNNGETPILSLDVKRLQPDDIIKLMDLHSGFMRRASQTYFPNYFPWLDSLAQQIFPQTAANSLLLFAEDGEAMLTVPEEIIFSGDYWTQLCFAYCTLAGSVAGLDFSLNRTGLTHFVKEGKQQLQADILAVASTVKS